MSCSIVIPTYNRADLLRIVLVGLKAQSLSPDQFEVLVCDDGSTEDLGPVCQASAEALPHLRHLRQVNSGAAAARNLGVRHACSEVILFMDSDVVPLPGVVEGLLDALGAHPEWVGAEAALKPTGEQTGPLWTAPASAEGGYYHTAGIAYRRKILEAVGGLDQAFKMAACEDVELAVRVLQHGPIGFVPAAVVEHPRRRVTWQTHWRGRKHWRYITILAVRYGILAFPGKSVGKYPRLRVAWCALVTQPAGRFLSAVKSGTENLEDALVGMSHAVLDVVGGLWALPGIFWGGIPERRDYLAEDRTE